MEEEFAVRVRAGPPPAARLLPSERRYSASTALGLALVHLALAALAALLLAALWRAPTPQAPAPPHPEDTALRAAAAALAAAALLPAAAGLLAWHRWYEDRNIRWLLGAALVSAAGALASLATTSAALASAHERYAELRLGLGPATAPAPAPATGPPRPSADPARPAPGIAQPSQPTPPAHRPLNASWPAPHPEATGGEASPGAAEEGGPAFETVGNASSEAPAPTEVDPSPHVFLFPGVHSPVDPEDENGTFQTIWKQLTGDVGLAQPTNPVTKDESDVQAVATTLEGTDAGFEPSESSQRSNHPPPEESHDIPLTEHYYHTDDYDEMESDESFPAWQHDVRLVPTPIPPSHVSYSASGEEVEHEVGDGTPLPAEHATRPLILTEAPSEDEAPAGRALQRRRREDTDAEDAEDATARSWDARAAVSLVLSLNLLAAALAEFAWSLWTLTFAWRGARSGYPGDEGRPSSPSAAPRPLSAARAPPAPKHAPAPAPASSPAHPAAAAHAHAQHLHKLRRPDLISNHQQKDPILQETTMPYQERVRRFLASETPVSAETQIE